MTCWSVQVNGVSIPPHPGPNSHPWLPPVPFNRVVCFPTRLRSHCSPLPLSPYPHPPPSPPPVDSNQPASPSPPGDASIDASRQNPGRADDIRLGNASNSKKTNRASETVARSVVGPGVSCGVLSQLLAATDSDYNVERWEEDKLDPGGTCNVAINME